MDNQYNGIWVFAEQRGGELHDVSLELLGKSRELAGQAGLEVTAVLLGSGVRAFSQRLFDHGADSVLIAEDARLADYRLLPYALVLEAMIGEFNPEIFVMGATAMGVELAPRVAAKVGTGLSAHCIDLKLNEQGHLLQVVPGWGGGVLATITCPDRRPQMATVMPGAMKALAPEKREGSILDFHIELPDRGLGPEVLEVKRGKSEELPLEKADVVVAGGWGIGGPENWKLIEALADCLNGAVGATRPPVDEGWVAEGRMIGQSGKTVRPTLYIGAGISGVMHHVVGMDQSKLVIAVNSDPKAEIFDASDVIVVEDFMKILPPLIEAIKARAKK
ncbi:MAG: electron transfer flavoprotein subunit alpha/FixB family protein [Deltaproteobacteria bacterium]|nr:electron transfer flavoprotein subunit alpha/FixB family protein [Deltaproteobacteria bacterium]MBW2285694.1 electron transfer flavoprotein subunit alpha/FixB family protein [Deltaproteobacteria bacterium]